MADADASTRALEKELTFAPEKWRESERARTMPVTFDEDCPETIPERAIKFRHVIPVWHVAN